MVIELRSNESPIARDVERVPSSRAAENSGGQVERVQPKTTEVTVEWEGDDGVVVKFTDATSGELIRQIPPEQILSVARYIRQLLQQDSSGA